MRKFYQYSGIDGRYLGSKDFEEGETIPDDYTDQAPPAANVVFIAGQWEEYTPKEGSTENQPKPKRKYKRRQPKSEKPAALPIEGEKKEDPEEGSESSEEAES